MERGTLTAAQLSLLPYQTLIKAIGIEPRQLVDAQQFAAWLAACNQWLARHGRREWLVYSAPGHKSSAVQYERRIVEQGEIETRDDRHDSMNALIWLQYPHTKLAPSTLHLKESGSSVDTARRGPRRDAATLFDEHGVGRDTGDG